MTMPNPEELLRQARESREEAARVRRLAQGLSLNDDQARMLQQAKDLETQARSLEQQAAASDSSEPRAGPPGPPLQQEQVQQQQQHDVKSEPDDPKDSNPKS
jgi:hypothetical protein